MKEGKTSNRMIYLDVLRVLAAFSVVMLHSAAQFWNTLDVRSTDWVVANSYNAVFRFGVPIFVMISGALFLSPDYKLDVKRLFVHNILRLFIISVVWSSIYGLFDCLWLFNINDLGMKDILREMLAGRYHLWFLPMLMGIYVLIPILKSWLEHAEKRNVEYFILLFFLIQVGGETIRALTVTDEIHAGIDVLKVDMVCGYLGYFVLGYYLAHVGISDKWRKRIYGAAIPAALLNVLLGCLLVWQNGIETASIYDSFGLCTFVLVTAIFLICRNGKREVSEKTGMVLREISGSTMGAYLMHVGVMEFTESFGFHSMMIRNVLGIPMYAVICFAGCLLVASILRRIPVVGRYIC